MFSRRNKSPRETGASAFSKVHIQPANLKKLTAALTDVIARCAKVASVDLGVLNRLLAHVPEDMTVTVEAGLKLAALQTELARRGQWLPLDPPHPDTLTIGELLATNASGPRRYGYGTARDHLIGLTAVLADGRVVSSGGKVVKNVAGYDLHKLFIGARGTLGVIVEATFKLRPLPEKEEFVAARCESLAQAETLMESVLNSPVTPVVFDAHRGGATLLSPSSIHSDQRGDKSVAAPFTLVLAFAGSRKEVEWQLGEARRLGFTEAMKLDYEKDFWAESEKPQRISVLPSRVCETLGALGNAPFVARAGNGLIWHRGAAIAKGELPNAKLTQRVKDAFDPKHIFPELPL
ncbi:MAG: FAD-binding oxidoreductase [Verrucomicrobia bacterium]|nr:FAD-binding oxidoreductase [Verrucomicrobiota bacterium]